MPRGSPAVAGGPKGSGSRTRRSPETWVPALGDEHHGFPYLSGRGRLVVKDLIMLAAATVCVSDSARRYLDRHARAPAIARST